MAEHWWLNLSGADIPLPDALATRTPLPKMTQALALELPDGLAAIPLSPGVIDTPMLRKAWGDAAGHYASPEQWATRAAPYILNLSVAQNGQSLTVPDS